MQGQELPSLGTAKEISVGNLPDGIRYYLVTNTARKGFADYALVQRGWRDAGQARSVLQELPHFGSRKPYRFLSEHGIGYAGDGYISLPADAALYTFHDVPAYEESVADSTLLMLFDAAATYRKPQAIIICGDINAARVRERMELLSMMVPPLEYNYKGINYAWTPRDTLSFRVALNTTGDVAAINAIFSTQRLPREVMDTPQMLLTKAYADQLGQIVRQRVERSFRSAGIPLADFRYRYQDSGKGPGDERHSITVYTSARYLDAATRQFASILSALDKDGAGMDEFQDTRQRLVSEAKRYLGGRPLSNAEYLEKCVSNYLYGGNLASEATLSNFIITRRLEDERELGLFNGFAQALLDSTRNLTLRFDIPDQGLGHSGILGSFNRGWAHPAPPQAYKANFGDTLSLYQPAAKARLRAETAEPISGGRLWTFSNGIKVIYKKMSEGQGEFHYALMLRGGVAEVSGLQEGESAFVGDMLALSDVAGLSGTDFREMLLANGITMQETATLSDLRITGTAPRAKLPLLMRSLLSVADKRQPNADAFAYYKASETLRIDMEALSPRDVNSLMDSIMRPNYFYTDRKQTDRLRDDLPARAEQYFSSVFDKVNDGILVFMGDLDEDVLKKELSRTLGDFRTQKKFSSRPRVESRFASGSTTRTADSAPGVVGGGEIGVSVAMSAAIPFNMENYMSFKVACALIRKHLTAALADQGAYAEVSDRLELFPTERLSLFINCRPCREDGLPAGMTPAEPLDLLDAVRGVTRRLGQLPIQESDLKAYKDVLLKQMESRMQDPAGLVDDVLTRYSEGKDLVTDYKTAIQKVSTASVAHIIELLRGGAEVEYVII
ncbi:MAG: hypothetical protein K5910_07005 [Bacteroidales bacterium]|nr:hypothetical protein [Bacteroidales bacterium]